MNIILTGPGSIGCLLAATLARKRSGNTITLLGHNADHAQAINTNGILYESVNEREEKIAIRAVSSPTEIPCPPDALLFCVKSYDLPAALQSCTPLLQSDPLVLLTQNGIAHLSEEVTRGIHFPAFLTTTEGATQLGPGHIRHAGKGVSYTGFLKPPPEKKMDQMNSLVASLRSGGLDIHLCSDILSRIWQKLLINCCINPLTVIHNCENGKLLDNSAIINEMKATYAEAKSVAEACRIPVTTDFEAILDVCRKTASNVSSMLQDIRNGRQTEIDAINGALVAKAERLGIATPVNRHLVRQIHRKTGV